MALVGRTSIGRHGIAAIAAGVFTGLAVASSGPAWGQDTGEPAEAPAASQAETMAAAGMRMMMGAQSDGSDAAALTGHGFLLDKGVFTTIDHPDAVAETGASSISNRGRIVGGYVDAEGTTHGFLLDDGVFTPIDHPDAPQEPRAGTPVFGINDHGQIVGFQFDVGAESARGFLLGSHDDPGEEGVFTAIDVPGAVDTLPSAIDNRGQLWAATATPEEPLAALCATKGVLSAPSIIPMPPRDPTWEPCPWAPTTVARSWANTSRPTCAATVSC
jgi:probable HAF family extracellular repeat protein